MKMRAIQSFVAGTKHADLMIHGGATFDADDPVVKAFPAFFVPVSEAGPEVAAQPKRQRGAKANG